MPRGNLETVHPRALVLSAVRKALDKYGDFREFELITNIIWICGKLCSCDKNIFDTNMLF